MDITRIQKLAGIISESADVTSKVKKAKLDTKDGGEAITNKIVQGENGDVRVADEVEITKKPSVPKDTTNKKIGLKEEFGRIMNPRDFGQPDPEKVAQKAPYYKAFHDWKAECTQKSPGCNFIGTATGTQCVLWQEGKVRPLVVGDWDKASGQGKVY